MSIQEYFAKLTKEETRLVQKTEKLKEDLTKLNSMLLRPGIAIDTMEEAQKMARRLRNSYDEYSFKLREVRRKIEQVAKQSLEERKREQAGEVETEEAEPIEEPKTPVEKMFPIELIDETGEVKHTTLNTEQLRHLIRVMDEITNRSSLTTKKKPDGSSVVQVIVDGIDQADTPPFIHQLFKNATSQIDLALSKLLKIAQNQQTILTKLAYGPSRDNRGMIKHQQDPDPNVEYLRGAVQAALVNAHLKATHYYVMPLKTPVDYSKSVQTPTGYQVSVDGAINNNETRQAFINALKKQVATQKPDLSANLSIIFTS